MRCPNCQSEQDQTHFYCAVCGQALHQSVSGQQPEGKPEFNVDALIDQIKQEARVIESVTVENIQGRTEKWIKINAYLLTFALGILLAGLGYFGYEQKSDLKEIIDKKKDEVNKLVDGTKVEIDKAMQVANETLEEALEIQQSIQNINVEDIQKKLLKIAELKRELDQSIEQSDKIRSLLTTERENIQKLQNSFYSVSLQHSERFDENKFKDTLKPALNHEGFQLNPANIVQVGVNRTEVIYYNLLAEDQAQMLATILQENLSLPRVDTKYIKMLDRNPREILIKLAP